jgi:hypothetical protein
MVAVARRAVGQTRERSRKGASPPAVRAVDVIETRRCIDLGEALRESVLIKNQPRQTAPQLRLLPLAYFRHLRYNRSVARSGTPPPELLAHPTENSAMANAK